jgi:hypothetical protein
MTKAPITQDIYVDVRHHNFWWGLYGFCPPTDWEDLLFFEKQGAEFVRIGAVCVCSRRYLEQGLEALPEDPDEQSYVEEVKRFLQEQTLAYHYYYDEPDDSDFYEVTFEAQRNARGIKPSSIEMWYPGTGIEMSAVETCTRAFCRTFLNRAVNAVVLKEIPPFEEMAKTYQEYRATFQDGVVQVAFTDELVESLARKWNLSPEEVLRRLWRSV